MLMLFSVSNSFAVRPVCGYVWLRLSCAVSRPSERPAALVWHCQALRFARENPLLAAADVAHRAALHQVRVGLLRVPLIGEATPVAVGVTHQQARFDQARADAEILHQHGAVREIPVVVRPDGDGGAVRQRHPAFLGRVVRPERRVDGVGNQPGSRLRRIRRIHAARRAQRRGNRAATTTALEIDPVQRAAGVVHDVQLAVIALAERGDVETGLQQLRRRA